MDAQEHEQPTKLSNEDTHIFWKGMQTTRRAYSDELTGHAAYASYQRITLRLAGEGRLFVKPPPSGRAPKLAPARSSYMSSWIQMTTGADVDPSTVTQTMYKLDREAASRRATTIYGCMPKQEHLKRIYEASRRPPAVPIYSTTVVLGATQGCLEVRSPQTASQHQSPFKFELVDGRNIRIQSEWVLNIDTSHRQRITSGLSSTRLKLKLRSISEGGRNIYEFTLPRQFLDGYYCGQPAGTWAKFTPPDRRLIGILFQSLCTSSLPNHHSLF